METLKVRLRWMIRRDMAEVMAIERAAFEFPWFEEDFVRCLRQRNVVGMVAEDADRVVGFLIYELHKKRIHLLNFAVHPDLQRRGVGRQVIATLANKLSSQRRNRITLEVRERNLSAQLFLKQLGFRAVGVLRNHYEEAAEDAYLMQFRHQAEGSDGSAYQLTNRIAGMEV